MIYWLGDATEHWSWTISNKRPLSQHMLAQRNKHQSHRFLIWGKLHLPISKLLSYFINVTSYQSYQSVYQSKRRTMNPTSLHATACIGCRRRGRKCDRTLPTCLSCERRGVCCEGYVTKWPGVAARGKLAGKSIPVVDSSVAIRNSHFTETKARQSQTKRTALAKSPSCSSFTDEEIDKFVHHCNAT